LPKFRRFLADKHKTSPRWMGSCVIGEANL
jgi:hypothetical protein